MSKSGLTRVFLGTLLLASRAIAQTFPADFDRYLVPVYIQGELQGAFGSRWVTEVSLLNTSAEPALIYGYEFGCFISTCPPVATPPGATLHPFLLRSDPSILGTYLFVEKRKTATFTVRVRDVSREHENFGTEIPVVAESSARGGTLNLLGIPTDPRYRSTLRIYDFRPTDGAAARIRIFAENGAALPADAETDVLFTETSVPFALPQTGLTTTAQPGVAERSSISARFLNSQAPSAFASRSNPHQPRHVCGQW